MRHNVAGRLFGRTANQRKALLRGLVGSLIEHERIETTLAKAKETRKIAEKLVTLGKRGDLHAKRLVMARLPNRSLVVKLFDSIAPRFSGRNGGYLRIVQTRRRVNDRADMAVLEFVDYEDMREKGQEAKGEGKKKTSKKSIAKKTSKKKETAKPAEEKKETAKKTVKKKEAAKPAEEKKETAKKTVKKKKPAIPAAEKRETAKKTVKKKEAAKPAAEKRETAKKTVKKKEAKKEKK